MNNNSRGFTLIEALVVVGILAILAAISYPLFNVWGENATYRAVSRNVASILRDARASAISRSNMHQVTIGVGNREIFFQEMDRDNGNYIDVNREKLITLPALITLRSGAACNGAGDISLEFRPDGSAILPTVPLRLCIMDSAGSARFFVDITSAASGRIVITRQ
jgi:prepilin-type N-terminal cleavage/methylation domain-containing protein